MPRAGGALRPRGRARGVRACCGGRALSGAAPAPRGAPEPPPTPPNNAKRRRTPPEPCPLGTPAKQTPQVLRETQGYTINDAGAETNIQVQKFAYSKRTRTIRNGARDARAAGVAVRELRQRDLTPDVCRQLMAVTGGWLFWGGGCFVGVFSRS